MGCRELIESLRTAGDERIRQARSEAETEADCIKADAEARIARAREANDRKHAAEAARHEAVLAAEANTEARRIRIRTERELAEKLLAAARSSLTSLRNVGYRDVFIELVRELPPVPWKTVRVNSEDVELGKELFPDVDVIADPSVTGGLIASSEGDRIRVVNTFEKRLERLWEEMLPDLVREVKEMVT